MANRPSPLSPVEGLIIPGQSGTTAKVSGRVRQSATATKTASLVEIPGQASLQATGSVGKVAAPHLANLKTGAISAAGRKSDNVRPIPANSKPSAKGDVILEVPLSFTPSTSKAAMAKTVLDERPTPLLQNPAPGLGCPGEMDLSSPQTASNPGSKVAAKKRISPARREFLQRRAAVKKLQQIGNKPADSLTPQEIAAKTWATNFLAEHPSKDPPAPKGGPKRQRSVEDRSTSQQPGAKRVRPPVMIDRSYSEIARGHLVKAIIDRSDPDGSISVERWDIIRVKLMRVVMKVIKDNPGPPPDCDDAGWHQGRVKLMTCHDERSATLLRDAVLLIDGIWEGAKLDVVSMDEIPRRPRSTALVHDGLSSKEEIQELLKLSNPNLPVHDWKVVKVSEPKNSLRRITVVLNHESLEPLRQMRGKVSFGFEKIVLHVYRGDDKGSSKQEDSGSSLNEAVVNESSDPSPHQSCQVDLDPPGIVADRMDLEVDEDALLYSDEDQDDVVINITPLFKE